MEVEVDQPVAHSSPKSGLERGRSSRYMASNAMPGKVLASQAARLSSFSPSEMPDILNPRFTSAKPTLCDLKLTSSGSTTLETSTELPTGHCEGNTGKGLLVARLVPPHVPIPPATSRRLPHEVTPLVPVPVGNPATPPAPCHSLSQQMICDEEARPSSLPPLHAATEAVAIATTCVQPRGQGQGCDSAPSTPVSPDTTSLTLSASFESLEAWAGQAQVQKSSSSGGQAKPSEAAAPFHRMLFRTGNVSLNVGSRCPPPPQKWPEEQWGAQVGTTLA